MKKITPLIWLATIVAIVLFGTDNYLPSGIVMIAVYIFGIYEIFTDKYLTPAEKGWCTFMVLLMWIVGICLAQLYMSAVMRKRFKLKMNN